MSSLSFDTILALPWWSRNNKRNWTHQAVLRS